jgi:hypothetical protein
MSTNRTLDARAAPVAARQLGLLSTGQARTLGFTRHDIRRRLVDGRWRLVIRGVYAISGAPRTWEQVVLAACLAGPDSTVGSHITAGALWTVCERGRQPDVTVPPGASVRSTIATVHRSPLAAADITRIGPIPVTRVPRTLIDLSSQLSTSALERAVDTALDGRLTDLRRISAAIERAQRGPGRQGIASLRSALEPWAGPIQPGSAAESRLLRRLKDWGLPTPIRQHVVRSSSGEHLGTVDVAWPASKVGLEYDSPRFHGPRRYEHDEQRHERIEAAGWRLEHADMLDLRPAAGRLPELLRPLLRTRAA